MTRLFTVCAVAIALSGSPAPIRADAGASASITYSGTPAGGGSDGPHSGTTHAEAIVTDGANLAKSQADTWALKTYAALDLLATQSSGQAIATASYTDSIIVSASDPGTITFVFQVDGTLTPGSDFTLTGFYNGQIVDNPTWFYEAPNIDTLWGYSVGYTPGVPFDFQMEARARALPNTGGTGPVISDFLNTATMDSIQLDNPDATVAGMSGFNYQFLVPEPASVIPLLLIGSLLRQKH